ncbi:MAG: hypothetical protein ABFS56_29285 [Pseudomonadota bacterium]
MILFKNNLKNRIFDGASMPKNPIFSKNRIFDGAWHSKKKSDSDKIDLLA